MILSNKQCSKQFFLKVLIPLCPGEEYASSDLCMLQSAMAILELNGGGTQQIGESQSYGKNCLYYCMYRPRTCGQFSWI